MGTGTYPAFREWFGDWENNPDEASKVRDANGEPLVVYHGTPISRDQAADRSKFRIADDWEIQTINAPFHTFRGGAYNGLIFTSLTEEKARSIGETRSMSIPDSEDGREQWTTDSYVYDLFVNARKPFDVKNPNAVKDILDALEGQLTAYDFYLGMEVPVSGKRRKRYWKGEIHGVWLRHLPCRKSSGHEDMTPSMPWMKVFNIWRYSLQTN